MYCSLDIDLSRLTTSSGVTLPVLSLSAASKASRRRVEMSGGKGADASEMSDARARGRREEFVAGGGGGPLADTPVAAAGGGPVEVSERMWLIESTATEREGEPTGLGTSGEIWGDIGGSPGRELGGELGCGAP